ncbi:energy transducer TonB [Vibrio profundum]|uniref:energy transducer TonB n=1 Tax=Vibrio profundum TaxID=2910247 RepID=UPI003D0FF926
MISVPIYVMSEIINNRSFGVILLVSLSIHLLLLMGVAQKHTHGGKLGSLNVVSLSNFSSVQIATSRESVAGKNPKQVVNQTITKKSPPAPSVARQPVVRHGRIASKPQDQLEKRTKDEMATRHPVSRSKPAEKTDAKSHPQSAVEPKVNRPNSSSPASSAAQQAGQLGSQSEPAVNTAPAFKSQPVPPIYPNSARRFGREGEVLVRVVLDNKGNKTNITVLHSSGYRSLDRSALAAVKKWQFIAYQSNGHPVPSQVTIPIRFSLG